MKDRQPLRSHEVRRMHDAKLAIHLSEDHVEMNRSFFTGHDDDDDLADFGVLKQNVREMIDCSGTRALAEADHQDIATKRMDVTALERVVEPVLPRAVVQNSAILQVRARLEDRLHDELFGPANPVAHRADHHVVIDAHRHVTGEEEIRKRRKGVPAFVERTGELTRTLLFSLDQRPNEVERLHFRELAGKRLRWHSVKRLADEALPRRVIAEHFGEQIPHVMNRCKAFEYGNETPVLDLRATDIHDVVVEVIRSGRRSYGEELSSWLMYQYLVDAADLGAYVDCHYYEAKGYITKLTANVCCPILPPRLTCEEIHKLREDVKRIAESTVRRLSIYLGFLEEIEERGVLTTSSDDLAKLGGTTSAQVRKDLSFFGSFGKRGLGYSVPELSSRLREILGLGREWRVCIVGAGNIGSALARYAGFAERGFLVTGVYDADPKKIGTRWGAVTVQDTESLEADIATGRYDIAVLTVPPENAQHIVDRLVRAGIKAILSFAPTQLTVPLDVELRTVNMAMELEALTFALTNRDRQN